MFHEQLRGCFPAEPGAWNVVHGIARQSEDVADQFRRHAPFRGHLGFAEQRERVLRRNQIGFRSRVNFHARTNELVEVLVVGREHDFDVAFAGGERVAAHEIVRFRVRQRDVFEAEQRGELALNVIELRDHRLRHFLARFLVGRLEDHPFFRQTFVPEDRAQLRLEMFDHEPQRFREPEDRVRRFAPRIGKILDREKRPVNVVMPVDEEQLHALTLW